jgi:DNA-binding transcriptional MerR regulator
MTRHRLYTLTELAQPAGVTPRTVRYYVAQGLLPSPGQPGPGAKYGDQHLDRLRAIRLLQARHLPLAEIRRRLDAVGAEGIAALTHEPPAELGSALDYVRAVLADPERDPGAQPSREPSAPLPPPAAEAPGTAEPVPTPMPERSQWERVVLAPELELLVRRPLDRRLHKRVERLIHIARELLEED